MFARLKGHFQEYVARYSILALAVLVPLSGALGTVAANLGGADSTGGRIALGVSSAVGTAIAGVTFLRNLGVWQMLDTFGTAPGVGPGLNETNPSTVVAGGDVSVDAGAPTAPTAGAGSEPDEFGPGSSPESPPDEGTQVPGEGPIIPDEDAQEELDGNEGIVPEGTLPESEATV